MRPALGFAFLAKTMARTTMAIAIAMAAVGATAVSDARAETGQATWTTYLYQGPGPHYSVTGEVPQATRFDISSCGNGWCEITYDKVRGYVREEIVAKGDPAKPADGLLPQPAASISPTPGGPCFEANQKGGNGGNALTIFCNTKSR